jgi:mRNA-degrading endonuclease RelE of RelBE toxin-antitoxin system
MTYTVVWNSLAKAQLAQLWLDAPDRAAITRAADKIDRQLRASPSEIGESRTDEYRVLYELPLVVAYRVSDDDRMVTVVAVRAV